jgi:hypothetical protein
MSGFANAAPRAAAPARSGPGPSGALKSFGLLPEPEPFWQRIEPGALGSVTVLVALILGLGYAGWTVLKEVQRVQIAPADVVPNVASDINPLVPIASTRAPGLIETDPLSAATPGAVPPTVTAMEDEAPLDGTLRIARPQALDVPVLVPRDGPIAAIVPPGAAAETPAAATDAAVIEALTASALEEGAAPQVVASGPSEVQIIAVRPSWIRVRAADGSVIFERVLNAGETYAIPQTEQPPTLHAGNSNAVFFLIDGQAYGPAAPGANVVRNVSLAASDLLQTYAAAEPGADADLEVHVARLRLQ